MVRVEQTGWAAGQATVKMTQSWFLADGSHESSDDAVQWSLPMTVFADGVVHKTVLSDKEQSWTFPATQNAVLKFNVGHDIVCRVCYSKDLLARLAVAVEQKSLNPVDRACLVQDGYALAKAGHLPIDDFVGFLGGYARETEYVVWDALSSVLLALEKLLLTEEAIYPKFCAFASALTTDAFRAVGFEVRPTDGHVEGLLR